MQPIHNISNFKKIEKNLRYHLKTKIANREWIFNFLTKDQYIHYFPYKLDSKPAKIKKKTIEPINQSKINPKNLNQNLPLYLVNVPMVYHPEDDSYNNIKKFLKIYKNQAFEESDEQSKKLVQTCLSIVIGVNRVLSLDNEINKNFREWMKNCPKIEGISCRIFGFFWKPVWIENTTVHKRTSSPVQAFKILKVLSEIRANKLRIKLEGSSNKLSDNLIQLIPYQQIREKIKASAHTILFANFFKNNSPGSPLYYGSMDADLLGLRTKTGLFTRLDKAISENNTPSAISLGYSVLEDRPMIWLGVKLDMACREATNKVIPFAPYFPEPCTFFCVKKPRKSLKLPNFSFLGQGTRLESRRFIQNGRNQKILKNDAVFIADGGVLTSTPKRMITKKNEKIKNLLNPTLLHKENLQSLRGIPQSHIFPKNWADNLYTALDFKCSRVTDATGPIMKLLSLYDPISRAFNVEERFSKKIIVSIFKNYEETVLSEKNEERLSARKSLRDLNMKKSMIDLIETAAKQAGLAIYKTLKPYILDE